MIFFSSAAKAGKIVVRHLIIVQLGSPLASEKENVL
jgi:hypothetical protein